ncbi:MAG: hypothetical protein IKN61_08875, partial [Bacteroidaceae bacterium]|nr:hypothetical protein [Bacteroidaceae bacterium]
DINGDGYPDYVTSDREDRMYVRYNTAGKTNLLRKVTNFTGNTVELDYQLSEPCYEKPQRSWNLTEIRGKVPPVSSGSANTTLNTFEYRNPHYDRYERMEYGYDTVITREHNTMDNDLVYRQNITGYNNVNFFKRGRKTSETIADGDGNPYIEHLAQATLYDYHDLPVSDSTCEAAGIYVGREVEATYYYEGHTPYTVVTAISKDYDSKRNITRYTNEGIVNGSQQEYFTADISYKQNMHYNLVSLPDTIVVKDVSGQILRRRIATYNNYGKMVHLTLSNNESQDAEYNCSYNGYGNMYRLICPGNDNGERVEYHYEYDTTVHTYPIRVENMSLGYYSTADYDLRFGKPTRTVDINGAEMRHYYDEVGRDTLILAPKEIADSVPYTIRMSYHPFNFKTLASGVFAPLFNPLLEPISISHAVTEHYDCQHEGDPIVTVLLSDGWGRAVQVKKDAEIHGQAATLVSGNVVYDCFGRVTKQYHPFERPPMDSTNMGNYHSNTNLPFTATDFDLMDRQLRVELPTGDTTSYAYDFGTLYGQQYFKTAVTDALGNTVTTLSGGLGQKLQVTMPGNTVTSFSYDPMVQLLNTTDPNGFITTYSYDILGRMTERNHPDAGTDHYKYDPAGNLITHTNALGDDINYKYYYNQLTDIEYPRYPANNVHYTYGAMGDTNNCAGRIASVEDASGWQKFSYGKLGEVTKNIRTFVLPFEETPYTFVMEYEYDSWNRIQSMTYPDGEVVSYEYNKGGMLHWVSGEKNGIPYPYINDIRYNKFELKESVEYGNGTSVMYDYDQLQRLEHLESRTAQQEVMQKIVYEYDGVGNILTLKNLAGILNNGLGGIYNNDYTYDNLYRLSAASGDWQGGEVLNYIMEMSYHKNGRVEKKKVCASTLTVPGREEINYQRRYFYETNSQPNTLTHIEEQEWMSPGCNSVGGGGGNVIGISPITPYTPPVTYEHEFNWDATGNMTYHHHESENSGYDRYLCWDEENRLQGVVDDTHQSFYQYDANGERTYKLTTSERAQLINGHWNYYTIMDNATLYASPYLVTTPQGYTKHYYAESERIASKIGMGGLYEICLSLCPDMTLQYSDPEYECEDPKECFYEKLGHNQGHFELVMGECLETSPEVEPGLLKERLYGLREMEEEYEPDCYWYHPDHLGSSSWITYSDGTAVQHLHYLPWGEEFVDQRTTNWAALHTFS